MLTGIWKDPVWSTVIAAGVVAVIGALGTYFLDFWPTIAAAASGTWQFLRLSTSVPNWVLALLSVASIPSVLLLVVATWSLFPRDTLNARTWRAYTTDTFFNLRWRWNYVGGRIYDLHTFCPHCDYQVFPHIVSPYSAVSRIGFKCDSCRRELGEFDEPDERLKSKVERFIQQKIRNNTWQANSDA